MIIQFRSLVPSVLLLATITGCGSSQGTVSGTVTIAGQPLAKGQIQFTPPSGGTPVGAPIVAGKYTAANIAPGERQVLITEEAELQLILSSEEMQKQAASGVRPAAPPKSRITPMTKGNGQTVTIKAGKQTLDFPLEP